MLYGMSKDLAEQISKKKRGTSLIIGSILIIVIIGTIYYWQSCKTNPRPEKGSRARFQIDDNFCQRISERQNRKSGLGQRDDFWEKIAEFCQDGTLDAQEKENLEH